MTYQPWREAWQEALYGPRGFYRRPEGPAGHFRTAAHASTSGVLGRALARLARQTGCTGVLDVGAGRGELAVQVAAADPGLTVTAVDVTDRPDGLPAAVGWCTDVPDPTGPTLLLGWELLDVVPTTVLAVDDAGLARTVLVDEAGRERLGPPPLPDERAWCTRWWPLAEPGARAEVGLARDLAWAGLVDRLERHGGLALAVDYGHDAATRPPGGSLAGYARGRQVVPVPDGGCDVTASVALDSVAAVRPGGVRLDQAAALRALGVSAPAAPPGSDPVARLRRLSAAGEVAELLDPHGLGSFGWVLHPVGEQAREGLAWTFRTPS